MSRSILYFILSGAHAPDSAARVVDVIIIPQYEEQKRHSIKGRVGSFQPSPFFAAP